MITSLLTMVRFASTRLTTRLSLKSERGATAVEYGLMVALIAAVIIAAVALLGTATKDTFECTGNAIQSKQAATC